MTALLGDAALFIPADECSSPVTPSDFDRLTSGYRLISGDRLERVDFPAGASDFRPPYIGTPPYSQAPLRGSSP